MDAIELTRQLIAMDTINPPGNERDCAHFLGELMAGAGFAVSYHEFAEARTTTDNAPRQGATTRHSTEARDETPWMPSN
jgi:acetylornithine deacetylase/succinyl-diaminopimelate desuccinylase-like protein